MPRIDDELLDCVIYLYRSVSDAQTGARAGGSGFVAGIPYADHDLLHGYAVTNSHTIERFGADSTVVIRLNRNDGGVDTITTLASEWVPHADGDDLAVCPIDDPQKIYSVLALPSTVFVTKERLDEMLIGIGDDVFMVGRFVDHEGTQRNVPTARFGNIAQMPGEPIWQKERGHDQISYLVEMRSTLGFSGSPVFLYSPAVVPASVRIGKSSLRAFNVPQLSGRYLGPYLLGVDWGHFPVRGKLKDSSGATIVDAIPEMDSSMAGVVPAWHLLDLLNERQFVEQRKKEEKAEDDSAS